MPDSLLRLQYSATDAVAATTAASAVLGSATVSSRHGDLLWEQVTVVDDGVSITLVRSDGEGIHLAIPVAAELVVVQVDAGEATLTCGDRCVVLGEHDLGLVPIGAQADLRWSSAQLQLFSVAAAPLARLLGVPRSAVQLHAPRIEPASPELAEYLRRTGRLLSSRPRERRSSTRQRSARRSPTSRADSATRTAAASPPTTGTSTARRRARPSTASAMTRASRTRPWTGCRSRRSSPATPGSAGTRTTGSTTPRGRRGGGRRDRAVTSARR